MNRRLAGFSGLAMTLSLDLVWLFVPAIASLGAFGAGWLIAERNSVNGFSKREEELQRAVESLRDEIWELKGAAAGRDKAEAANEAKSRFLATVSHEMRTPLNGILGMSELARGPNLTAEQAYYLEMIRASGGALSSLIEELLDFSKIEAGKLELVSAPFEITSIVERVVELLAPRAQGKGLEIASSIAPGLSRSFMGDAARLQQVLINLAGNAVKFTSTGGVGVRVSRTRDGVIRFAISDTGPGISTDKQEAVFADFEQADSSATRCHEGTGLGLAISRRIVEHMGGRLTLEQSDASGSLFVCEIPLPELTTAAAGGKELQGRSVLVVANSLFEAPWLGERLEASGARVIRAAGEGEAIQKLGGGTAFDIVIVDCALGAQITHRLAIAARLAGAGRSLVLFSPFERRAMGQQTLQDFDGWLVKPVRTGSLIARLTDQSPSHEADADSEEPQQEFSAGLAVLLAEDNEINAMIATKHLERIGANVVRAHDGGDALAICLDSMTGRRAPFDVLLLDIRMPGFDGMEVARRVRLVEAEKDLPPVFMVALTANAFDEDRRACMAAGIDEFLTKPVDVAKLKQVLLRNRNQPPLPGQKMQLSA